MNKLNLMILTLMCSLVTFAQAKTETFTLKSEVSYGEEGIYFPTNQGVVSLNMYALPSKVVNSLHKYNLNKGACIQVVSKQGFMYENETSGSGVQSITNCTSPAATKSRFNINQKTNVISAGRCYMNSCSWSKSINVQVAKQATDETVLKVTVLGASADFRGNYPRTEVDRRRHMVWNQSPHRFTVRCSYKRPAIISGNQVDDLPLNPEMGVPGVLENSASLYFQYCHSYDGSIDSAIRKFNYHAQYPE